MTLIEIPLPNPPWRCAVCDTPIRLGRGDKCKCTAAELEAYNAKHADDKQELPTND